MGNEKMKKENNVTFLYMIFGITFVAAILMGNVLAAKQLAIGTFSAPAGVLVFPLSYIMSDVVAEVYGYKAMRRIIWIGFAFTALQAILLTIAAHWAAPVWYQNSAAFSVVVGNAPRILLGQVLAYLVGEWANAVVISKMKSRNFEKNGTKNKFAWRAIASTIVGEGLDSLIFIPIAFVGVNPLSTIMTTVVVQASIKVAYEVIMLPVTSRIVAKVKKHEEIDQVDTNISYSLIK